MESSDQARILLGRVKAKTGRKRACCSPDCEELERQCCSTKSSGWPSPRVTGRSPSNHTRTSRWPRCSIPQLRKVLFELDRLAGAGDKVRRGLRVLGSFHRLVENVRRRRHFRIGYRSRKWLGRQRKYRSSICRVFSSPSGKRLKSGKRRWRFSSMRFSTSSRKEFGALIMADAQDSAASAPDRARCEPVYLFFLRWQASRSPTRSGCSVFLRWCSLEG